MGSKKRGPQARAKAASARKGKGRGAAEREQSTSDDERWQQAGSEEDERGEGESAGGKMSITPSSCASSSSFASHLEAYGLELHRIVPDGNCLFRAFADQHCGQQERHRDYREKAVAYIEARADDFRCFLSEEEESFKKYLSRMRRPGTWGSQMELQALSQVYKVNLFIHVSSAPVDEDDARPWSAGQAGGKWGAAAKTARGEKGGGGSKLRKGKKKHREAEAEEDDRDPAAPAKEQGWNICKMDNFSEKHPCLQLAFHVHHEHYNSVRMQGRAAGDMLTLAQVRQIFGLKERRHEGDVFDEDADRKRAFTTDADEPGEPPRIETAKEKKRRQKEERRKKKELAKAKAKEARRSEIAGEIKGENEDDAGKLSQESDEEHTNSQKKPAASQDEKGADNSEGERQAAQEREKVEEREGEVGDRDHQPDEGDQEKEQGPGGRREGEEIGAPGGEAHEPEAADTHAQEEAGEETLDSVGRQTEGEGAERHEPQTAWTSPPSSASPFVSSRAAAGGLRVLRDASVRSSAGSSRRSRSASALETRRAFGRDDIVSLPEFSCPPFAPPFSRVHLLAAFAPGLAEFPPLLAAGTRNAISAAQDALSSASSSSPGSCSPSSSAACDPECVGGSPASVSTPFLLLALPNAQRRGGWRDAETAAAHADAASQLEPAAPCAFVVARPPPWLCKCCESRVQRFAESLANVPRSLGRPGPDGASPASPCPSSVAAPSARPSCAAAQSWPVADEAESGEKTEREAKEPAMGERAQLGAPSDDGSSQGACPSACAPRHAHADEDPENPRTASKPQLSPTIHSSSGSPSAPFAASAQLSGSTVSSPSSQASPCVGGSLPSADVNEKRRQGDVEGDSFTSVPVCDFVTVSDRLVVV